MKNLKKFSFTIFMVFLISCSKEPEGTIDGRTHDMAGNAQDGRTLRLNASASVLFLLAKERFQLHDSKGEIWVLRVHDGLPFDEDDLSKYSDGQFTIASLPMKDDVEHAGMRLYVSHYNSFTIEKADTLALRGNYAQALKIYRLVQRFNNCSLGVESAPEPRIEIVTKLEHGENAQELKAKLARLRQNYTASVFEFVESKPATPVTNLFDLEIDR